jgi:hypothetical protein
MSITDLVKCLEAINTSDEIEEKDILNYGYITDRHQLIQDAVELADQLLTTDDGKRNLDNEIELHKKGFHISCLEKDSFGWLSAGIHTDKGVIAYG